MRNDFFRNQCTTKPAAFPQFSGKSSQASKHPPKFYQFLNFRSYDCLTGTRVVYWYCIEIKGETSIMNQQSYQPDRPKSRPFDYDLSSGQSKPAPSPEFEEIFPGPGSASSKPGRPSPRHLNLPASPLVLMTRCPSPPPPSEPSRSTWKQEKPSWSGTPPQPCWKTSNGDTAGLPRPKNIPKAFPQGFPPIPPPLPPGEPSPSKAEGKGSSLPGSKRQLSQSSTNTPWSSTKPSSKSKTKAAPK